jgi:hypothetical protein
VPGRPIIYKTTPEFLEAFGLRSLDELPAVDVDGTVPVELALPIPTLPLGRENDPAVSATPADPDEVEETDISAERETEPQPSAV